MNIMEVDGDKAKIEYDPDLDEFRGEILGLNGSAGFYGKSPAALRKEFRGSLKVFLDGCEGLGIVSMETDPIDSPLVLMAIAIDCVTLLIT